MDWIKLGNDANDKIKRQGKKIKEFGKTQEKLTKNIKEGNRRAERLIFYNFMKKFIYVNNLIPSIFYHLIGMTFNRAPLRSFFRSLS